MPTDLENFGEWFVQPLESLYPRRECGFVILYTAFPLLERYLRQKANIPAGYSLSAAFFAALWKLFPELRSEDNARAFWDTYRNGFLHQGTFNSRTHRGSVIHHESAVITLDASTQTFYLGTVDFTRRVLATIVRDFGTYAQGPALPTTPLWANGIQPTLGPTPTLPKSGP